MTILKCSAITCAYNKNEQCSKGEIKVDGTNAHYADETCCASFQERSTGVQNSYAQGGCGCEKVQIDCKAQECTYNDHCKCTASAIGISGSNACKCQETKCSTFSCKC